MIRTLLLIGVSYLFAHPLPAAEDDDGEKLWSLSKPTAATVPSTKAKDWARSDIDRFILAKLEAAEMRPAEDADPRVLLRRIYFDLIGLPPSPDDWARFSEQIGKAGIEKALDEEVSALMASPQFGERWGRHWLDVARYAESSGKQSNISFPYAWRYRDYVIDAVNKDLPYDRFLVEQIAGDLLPYKTPEERARLLIATGFLAIGPKNLDEANPQQFAADVIDEQIDTVSRAVMANSLACARCHDHKFDPFEMEDYYALAGLFASTRTFFGTAVSPANRVGGDPLVLPAVDTVPILHRSVSAERVKKWKSDLAALQEEGRRGRAAVMAAVLAGEDPKDIFTLRDALRIFWRSGALEGQLEKVDESGRALPLGMGVLDREKIIDARLLEGGDARKPGPPVPRGFPRAISVAGAPVPAESQSGRLEFARWLTHREHPLTARVYVNRVWQHLFGTAIVRTVDNFGVTGEKPSHPQLLDYLAIRLMDQGWSLKKLVKEIVMSRTYRQSSAYRADAFRKDPENRLCWRMSKRRLDAESIRDAMLFVSGQLDLRRPTGSLVGKVIGDRPISLIGLDPRIPADLDGVRHRAVYLPIIRDRLPDVLDLFDCAEPSLVTGTRDTTNVPSQALFLLNSDFVQARAGGLARSLAPQPTTVKRINRAFQVCFNRAADADEIKLAQNYLDEDDGLTAEEKFAAFCQALLAAAEFRYLD